MYPSAEMVQHQENNHPQWDIGDRVTDLVSRAEGEVVGRSCDGGQWVFTVALSGVLDHVQRFDNDLKDSSSMFHTITNHGKSRAFPEEDMQQLLRELSVELVLNKPVVIRLDSHSTLKITARSSGKFEWSCEFELPRGGNYGFSGNSLSAADALREGVAVVREWYKEYQW